MTEQSRMSGPITIGRRIRERRVISGLRQAELARRAGISPSYLNLIEHDRRRIGGKTLNKLAAVLGVAPALLSEGAAATLVNALREAAARAATATGTEPASDAARAEEFAGRFPGWARLLVAIDQERAALEQTVKALTDRLAHDPHLAASLHELISAVTAIRSTASILADSRALEPEWQFRFHRNLDEDSQRLSQGAEALVRYLEAAPDAETDIKSPQDELHAFLDAHGFHFPALEGPGGSARIGSVLDRSEALQSAAARQLARDVLKAYVHDARRLPIEVLRDLIAVHGLDPGRLAEAAGVDMAMVFRRLGMMPEALTGPVGLVVCDSAGAPLLRKPVLGFSMPRAASGCALWPLYQLLAQPDMLLRLRLRQGEARVLALAISEAVAAPRFDRPALRRPHMLLLPDPGAGDAGPARQVGITCQVCTLPDCAARREPSILGGGF